MSTTHDKEQTLQRAIGQNVEAAVPGVEVLAVELSSDDRFTVFIDHPEGVDERVALDPLLALDRAHCFQDLLRHLPYFLSSV